MTGFEHLQVLISVVIGLALTNLLSGIGSVLKGHTRFYWVQVVWALNLSVNMVLFWWFTFTDFAGIDLFHPFAYLFVLLYAFALYLPTRVLFPEPGESTDLRTHFFANRRVFFRLLLFVVAVDICDTIVKHVFGYAAPDASWFESLIGPWAAWTLLGAAAHWHASRTDREGFHAGWAVGFLAGIVVWLTAMIPLGND